MTELKQTVALTSATVEKMSRHDMLEWVNLTVQGQHKKIEELCSGVAYCQMMEMLFPRSIGLKKIKMGAKLEHEFLHNLKLFQNAFTRLKFDKAVPIDRLIKGRFQDNFEFLQWFKKFYDSHAAGKENLKLPVANDPKPIAHIVPFDSTTKATKKPQGNLSPSESEGPRGLPTSPSSIQVLQDTRDILASQMLTVETARNGYYEKLRLIEDALNNAIDNEDDVEWARKALNILYTTDDESQDVVATSSVNND